MGPPFAPQVALTCVSFCDTYLATLKKRAGPGHFPPVASTASTTGSTSMPGSPSHHQHQHNQQQQGERAALLQAHLPLLGQLLGGLVQRAALGPEAARVATADARDLPEEVRMVSLVVSLVTELVSC